MLSLRSNSFNRQLAAHIILFLAVSVLPALGQRLPARATISKPWWRDENRPSSFYEKKIREGDFGQNDKSETWWIVASDRAENTCYSSPGSGSIKGVMDLMETAAIIEIENGFAHLIQQSGSGRIGVMWPIIPGNAVDKGWVSVDNLLLFPKAITNENLIYEKAMVLTSIDDKTSRDNLEYNNSVNFKKGPDLKSQTDKFSKTFEIYYVFKRSGRSVLLGRSDRLTQSDQDKANILGWVSNSSVTFWNQRNCLEPNWKQGALQDFKSKGVDPVIFDNEAADVAHQFASSGRISDLKRVVKKSPFTASRQDGYIMRNPVIEQIDANTFKVGTIGAVTEGEKSEADIARIKRKIADMNDKMSNVNIIFVIDGTQSMGSFYQPVANALSSSIQKLRNSGNGNAFKFGAVVYRDYPDGGRVAEVKRLTADYAEVTSFLNQVKLSGDKDYHEAMFQGIEKGLKDCGMRRGQSNFIFLIGDAGNHLQDKKGLTESSLIKDIAEYECNLVAFQVNNGYDRAFDDFIDQTQTIIKGAAQEIAKAYGGNPKLCVFKSDGNNKHELDKLEGEVVDIPYMVGSFIFPTKGSSMPVRTLENEIEQKIIEFDKRVVQVKNVLESSTNIAGSGFTPNVKFILRKSGLSDKDIDRLIKFGTQLKIEGIISTKAGGCDSALFLPVVFLSRSELNRIVNTLEKIHIPSSSDAERRNNFREAMIGLIQGQLGALSADEILSKTMDEIYQILMGIPFKSSALKNIPLKGIIDPNVVSARQFAEYMDAIDDKLKELQKISNGSAYQYSFKANDQDFFWIPLEDIP
jgi:hypothetical protein